jgi:hypothetical protein
MRPKTGFTNPSTIPKSFKGKLFCPGGWGISPGQLLKTRYLRQKITLMVQHALSIIENHLF